MDLRHHIRNWPFFDVHYQADVNRSRVLPQDYSTLKKTTLTFWSSSVRMERRARSRCVVFVQWH